MCVIDTPVCVVIHKLNNDQSECVNEKANIFKSILLKEFFINITSIFINLFY